MQNRLERYARQNALESRSSVANGLEKLVELCLRVLVLRLDLLELRVECTSARLAGEGARMQRWRERLRERRGEGGGEKRRATGASWAEKKGIHSWSL